jgi:glyoxylase-like metal-dependent hydrolase (beta-lactamase superfamily II)
MQVTIVPVGMSGTNCYLLASDEKSCAIIDPGANAKRISGVIAEKGLIPKYILITHGHWDHTGAVKELMALFPEAELYIGEKDAELLEDPEKSRAIFRGVNIDDYIVPGAGRLADGETLTLDGLEITVIETPGHTRGGVCYICRDAIFAGDTLFYQSVGRCDLYGGNFDALRESLKRLCALSGDPVVYPGHGETTTLGYERAHNPYIKG